MVLVKRFILMLQFFTSIPLPFKLEVTNEDFGRGLVFAPIVGLLVGLLLWAAYSFLVMFFPVYVSLVFVLVLYIVITGGLHLDGLGDTFDGLFSRRSKERKLEIMRDSRVGMNAVLAVVSILGMNMAVLSSLDRQVIPAVLVLFPVAGRMGSLIGSGISKYARNTDGLGKSFTDFCGIKEIIIGFFASFIIFYLFSGYMGLILCGTSTITALAVTRIFTSRIGGATGDILGAVCEINQTLFLISVMAGGI
jgi:adenosylcobinamide-GDP ribazoletransferase